MSIKICNCQGLDTNCKKCFGSGYINTPSMEKSFILKEKKSIEKRTLKSISALPTTFDSLEKKELINVTAEIIAFLDLKSKKQMQILNSVPFSTNTFRRDFKEKFATLKELEQEKIVLREKLTAIDSELVNQKISGNFKFKHFLSDKEIDVDSNRQLKDLIRVYKKLKG